MKLYFVKEVELGELYRLWEERFNSLAEAIENMVSNPEVIMYSDSRETVLKEVGELNKNRLHIVRPSR